MKNEFCIDTGRFSLRISFGFLALLTLLFLCDGGGNFLLSAVAIFVHELAHICALLLLGGGFRGLRLSLCEFRILCEDAALSRRARLCVALSGPFVNLGLGAVLWHIAPPLALVNLVMGIFQLLPISTMDGDNVLELLRAPLALRRVISFLFCFVIAFFGFLVLLDTPYNFSVLAVSLYLVLLSLRLQ